MDADHPDLGIPGLTGARLLGAGGFGTVYECHEPEFGRTVAVKVLRDRLDDHAVRRAFDRECQAMGSLSGHPHIVTVHRSGTTDRGQPYIVMDLMSGGSLAERIARAPMPWPELLDVGVLLAGALETAHRRGILHLDLKPANVLVSRYGEPKLGDFGISRLPGVAETSGGVRLSPAYAAPERLADGATTVQSDLYGLGATLFALVTGTPAFSGTGQDDLLVMLARIAQQPVPDLRPRGVPEPVCAVVERLMAKDPAERFSRAADAVLALQDAQRATGRPVTRAVIEGAPTVTEEAAAPTGVSLPPVPAWPGAGSPPAGSTPGGSWPAPMVAPSAPARPQQPWRPPADTYVPPPGAPPPIWDPEPGPRAPQRQRGLVVAIAAVVLVVALGAGAAVLLTRSDGGGVVAPPTFAAPSSAPASTQPAPSTTTSAPAAGSPLFAIAAGVTHPETANVTSTLQAYVDTIDTERYVDTFALFSPDSRTAQNGLDAWLDLQRPREISAPTLTSVQEADDGALDVVWTFVSRQAPADSPDGTQACTDWEVAFEMAGPGPEWLIRTSEALASRAC